MRDRKQKLNLTSTFVHLPNLTTWYKYQYHNKWSAFSPFF
jgi:hypothetical protein